MRKWILDLSVPITKLIGKLHAPFSVKYINGFDYFRVREKIVPGQIFLSRTRGMFSNNFIPGFFTHAAICIDSNTICEAVGEGVRANDIISFMLSKDYLVLLRPSFATPEQMQKAADFARENIGKPYDYEFQSDLKAFYCSELCFASYKEAMNGNSPLELRERLGDKTIVPSDIWAAKDKFSVVYQSEETKNVSR
jgi:uncharacterized protein YycO